MPEIALRFIEHLTPDKFAEMFGGADLRIGWVTIPGGVALCLPCEGDPTPYNGTLTVFVWTGDPRELP